MGWIDWLILAALTLCAALALRSMRRRGGLKGCCGDCARCQQGEHCARQTGKEKER